MILGASGDSVSSHRKFRKKYELPFTLIADPTHLIAEEFGVWKEKSMFGRKYMGIERTTFLIDPAGRIAKIFEKVDVLGHANEVAAAIEALRSPGTAP